MDFDEVLRTWEANKSKGKDSSRRDLGEWVDAFPPTAEEMSDRESADRTEGPAEYRRRVRAMHPQRILDLHGAKAVEARRLVDRFIAECVADGIEKVLVIHGKGNHSKPGARSGVLKDVVYSALRDHPLAGETGVPDRKLGGSGAVWVVLRQRSR